MSAMWALWAFKTELSLWVCHVCPSSIHFTQKLRRRECDWRTLSSVEQNAKPKPVIQLASYSKSSLNNPGIIQNSGIKPGSWWHPVLQNWPVLLVVTDMGKVFHHVPGEVFLSLTLEIFPPKVVPALLSVLLKWPTAEESGHTCVTQCPHEHWMNFAALSEVFPPQSFQKNWWERS